MLEDNKVFDFTLIHLHSEPGHFIGSISSLPTIIPYLEKKEEIKWLLPIVFLDYKCHKQSWAQLYIFQNKNKMLATHSLIH